MRKLRKYRGTIVGIIVFVALVVGGFYLKNIIAPDESQAIYGERLEGRDAVKITDATKKKVQDALKENTTSVKVRVAGKIVNVTIELKGEVSRDDAKKMGTTALEQFSEQEVAFYDFQFLIKNENNKEQFPIIGYKHHGKENISWTKDR